MAPKTPDSPLRVYEDAPGTWSNGHEQRERTAQKAGAANRRASGAGLKVLALLVGGLGSARPTTDTRPQMWEVRLSDVRS
jgi:hypothetical protein